MAGVIVGRPVCSTMAQSLAKTSSSSDGSDERGDEREEAYAPRRPKRGAFDATNREYL